jgi:hypothetical protein
LASVNAPKVAASTLDAALDPRHRPEPTVGLKLVCREAVELGARTYLGERGAVRTAHARDAERNADHD